MNSGGRRRAPKHNGHGGTHKSPARNPARNIEPLHPSAEPPDIRSFREWALSEEIQTAIEAMGIQTPTPIQRLAIGPVLEGKDVIAKAETGTGKTLAFGAPMMSKIDASRATVLGLVLCPTRELAQQVADVLVQLGNARGIKVALIVGGEPMHPQVDALKAGAQVVVGTPGRVLDLYKQRFLGFPWTEFAVLDEADEMLEIGFIDDVKEILGYTPEERQTLLFSATYPTEVLSLARSSTRDPIEVATASGVKTVDTIEQSFIKLDDDERALALIRLIEQSAPEDVFLVFCSRRTDVDQLMRRLERQSFPVKALHGGFDQASRFRVMSAFRSHEVKALVATDVASRGLDVKHVTHVINYSVPQDISDYTHRIGRTGRAGRAGTAITFVMRRDAGRWKDIQAQATWDIAEAEAPAPSRRGRPDGRAERRVDDGSDQRPGGRPRAASGLRAERGARGADAERPLREGRGASSSRRPQARETRRGAAARAAHPFPEDHSEDRRREAPVRTWPLADEGAVAPHGEALGRERRTLSTRERLRLEREEQSGPSGDATSERRPRDSAARATQPRAPAAGRSAHGRRRGR